MFYREPITFCIVLYAGLTATDVLIWAVLSAQIQFRYT